MLLQNISFYLAFFLATAPESETGVTPSPPNSPSSTAAASGFQRAYDLFERGEFREAADAFDQLFADFEIAKFRHYAALSWAAAGDDTRAILRWHRLLAGQGLNGPLETEARRYLEGAYQRTSALSITVSPVGAFLPTSEIVLEHPEDDAGSGQWRPLSVTREQLQVPQGLKTTGFKLYVRPGHWQLGVRNVHPGYEPLPVGIDAQTGREALDVNLVLQPRVGELRLSLRVPKEQSQALELVIEDSDGIEAPMQLPIHSGQLTQKLRVGTWRYELRDPEQTVLARGSVEIDEGETEVLLLDVAPQGPKDGQAGDRTSGLRFRTRLSLGLGGGGLGLLAGGLAWLPYGQADSLTEFFTEGSTVQPTTVIASHERLVEGLIFVSSGVGVEAGALSVFLGAEERGLAIEAGVGGAAFAGGLALVLSGGACLDKTPYIVDDRLANEASIRECRRRDFAGATIAGSGVGLLTSSAIALVTRALVKRHDRRRGKHLKIRAQAAGSPRRGLSIGVQGSF